MNMITKYLLSLALTLAYVYSPAQETNIQDQSDQCEFYPIMEDMKTWIKDRKRAKKKKLITVAGLGVYKDQLYMIDNNIRIPDIYTFDFESKKWKPAQDSTLFYTLQSIYGEKYLPWGLKGIEIVNDTLFALRLENKCISAIQLGSNERVYDPIFRLPDYHGSDGAMAIAYSYPMVYLAYHALDYKIDIEKTQRLFGVNVETGDILFDSQLYISHIRRDGVHALTSLGMDVWHGRENEIVRMDNATGEILSVYQFNPIGRPSSMCFYKNSL